MNYEQALLERIDEQEFVVEEARAMDYPIPDLDTSDIDESVEEEQDHMAEVCAPYDIVNDGRRVRALDKETGKVVRVAKNLSELVSYLEPR